MKPSDPKQTSIGIPDLGSLGIEEGNGKLAAKGTPILFELPVEGADFRFVGLVDAEVERFAVRAEDRVVDVRIIIVGAVAEDEERKGVFPKLFEGMPKIVVAIDLLQLLRGPPFRHIDWEVSRTDRVTDRRDDAVAVIQRLHHIACIIKQVQTARKGQDVQNASVFDAHYMKKRN